jgi:hypothetical protein
MLQDTVCFTDLYQDTEMIIFESILTTFIASIVFRDRWRGSKNWLELKIKQHAYKCFYFKCHSFAEIKTLFLTSLLQYITLH